MKYCPKCGANVEGLVHHCDCCGALLTNSHNLFAWNSYMVSACGDLSPHIAALLDFANSTFSGKMLDSLPIIAFTIYCYPLNMIQSLNLKDRMYYSRAKGEMHITVLIDCEKYLGGNPSEKRSMVKEAICSHLYIAARKYEKDLPDLEEIAHKVCNAIECCED